MAPALMFVAMPSPFVTCWSPGLKRRHTLCDSGSIMFVAASQLQHPGLYLSYKPWWETNVCMCLNPDTTTHVSALYRTGALPLSLLVSVEG